MGGYIPPAYITISWLAKRGSVCLERNKAINFFRGQGVGEGVGEGPGPEAIGRAEFPAVAYNQ